MSRSTAVRNDGPSSATSSVTHALLTVAAFATCALLFSIGVLVGARARPALPYGVSQSLRGDTGEAVFTLAPWLTNLLITSPEWKIAHGGTDDFLPPNTALPAIRWDARRPAVLEALDARNRTVRLLWRPTSREAFALERLDTGETLLRWGPDIDLQVGSGNIDGDAVRAAREHAVREGRDPDATGVFVAGERLAPPETLNNIQFHNRVWLSTTSFVATQAHHRDNAAYTGTLIANGGASVFLADYGRPCLIDAVPFDAIKANNGSRCVVGGMVVTREGKQLRGPIANSTGGAAPVAVVRQWIPGSATCTSFWDLDDARVNAALVPGTRVAPGDPFWDALAALDPFAATLLGDFAAAVPGAVFTVHDPACSMATGTLHVRAHDPQGGYVDRVVDVVTASRVCDAAHGWQLLCMSEKAFLNSVA